MKTLCILIFGILAFTGVGYAQTILVTNIGWLTMDNLNYVGVTNTDPIEDTNSIQYEDHSQLSTGPSIISEAVTPEIQALADGLQDDPVRIFNYVHDHIRFVLYFGSKKGAALTLLEKSGNDFDQCALLVALLHAAGYDGAGYQFGWMALPYDNTDGSHQDLHHWLGLSFTNNDWTSTTTYLDHLFKTQRGYPISAYDWGNNAYAFQRVWVTLSSSGTNYLLDPAFKVSEPIAGINLPAAMGYSNNVVMSAAGGFSNGDYVTNLDETSLNNQLKYYTTALVNCLQSNYPNASVDEILGGQRIVPGNKTVLDQSLLFQPTNLYGTMPVVSWTSIPTNFISTLQVSFLNTNYQCFIPLLQGRRLSLTVSGAGSAQLWLDDSLLLTASSGGQVGTFNLTMNVYHPGIQSRWDTTGNVFIRSAVLFSQGNIFNNLSSSYAIMYAFDPDWSWLQSRQRQLEAYRQQGLADTSRQVVTESLNVMGLNWQIQVERIGRILGQEIGVLPQYWHRMGRMSQESGNGYYVDVYMAQECSASSFTTNNAPHMRWFDQILYFGSAMESGLIEQLQTVGLTGISTVKIFERGLMTNAPFTTAPPGIYVITSNNWGRVQGDLVAYHTNVINSDIAAGNILMLPRVGIITIGSWPGWGVLKKGLTGSGMLIGSVYYGPNQLDVSKEYGGYTSDLNATLNPEFVNISSYAQPLFYGSSSALLPRLTGADPVNMADGTFQVQATDLTLGQTEPRGLSFSRYYNSSRRNSDHSGLSPGWIHNYYLNAATVSAPQAELGDTTPAQMAAILVATTVASSLYDPTPEPKNWMVTALTAKWGVDQLTAKAVSISLGQDTLQFIKQPDGSFTPPANSTMTLTQAAGTNYILQERHGRTFTFNKSGWCTNIADQYGQSSTLTYNGNNDVSTVKDWKNRTLTLNYAGTPSRITSVTDGSRTVGYSYHSSNLVSVVDMAGGTNQFLYDTNHQITATFDAANQLVASNIYNAFGRVTTQFTQGDTNKTWKIFWSGWQTVSQDPAGGQTFYLYDDKTRLIAQQDPLGNVSRSFYDGQDHVTATVSALNETNQFIFDGNQNMVQAIDPLGFSNQFIYDAQNNLVTALDALNHPTTFGYNAKFQKTGQTNAAGDWINFAYDSTDGVLTSRTDEGGTTTYGYDTTYRLLNNVTYPNSLGVESFANSYFGDVTNHTDARGFSTAYQYNTRRQLTNTIAPTNLTVKVAFDAVGNQSTTTDARGFTYSNTWSATRHLIAARFPATAQGVAVITNLYDQRDWLVKTLDPFQQSVLYTNDANGRLVSQTDPMQRTTSMGFDANGRTVAATNAAQEVTRQVWDARGKLAKQSDGAAHSVFSTYDAAGNQTTLTNRKSNVWRFQFDAANRPTNTTTPFGRSSSVTFNHRSLPATIADPANQTTTLTYDAKSRLATRADNVATTLYQYDANDNQTNVVESGKTNSWTYNAYNQVVAYSDANGFLIQYRYDLNGNLTNLVYPGGKNVFYAYDNLNRLTNVTDWSQRKTAMLYDLAGRMTSLTRPNGTHLTNNFDAAGEVTNILDQMANTLPIAWFKFNWTNNGSMGWEFSAPLPHTATAPTRTMEYDTDNRLTKVNGANVTSDADGNLTYAPLPSGTFATYVFDARNRLSNVGGVTNIYDALNNRVKETYGTNSTVFVVNPNSRLPQTLMRIKNGVTNYYIYGAGLVYQITETATRTNTLTYHFDYRGSTVALSDDSGNITDRFEYSLYGLATYRKGYTDTPFQFDGKYGVQTDANTLLYMKARHYNPYLCRFVSPDPSGFAGGLNLYAFANGNPANLVDPFGLGALESSVDLSWFNAPTAAQTETQNLLAGFANFATLGIGNLASSAFTGRDLAGNTMNVADAYQQVLETGVFVASLALSIPTDGASLEAETVLEGTVANRTLQSGGGQIAAEGTTMFSRELGSTGPRATTELLDMMQAHGRTITTATEGSEALRFLDTMGAEASVGGPGHLSIILRENPSRAAAVEEFLHGTQDRLGIIDRLGVQGAENHVSDFMTRHSKLLGLEP